MSSHMPRAPLHPFLAAEDQGYGGIFFWALVLVVFVFGLFGVVILYRKWMNRDDTTSGPGFTLSDFRRLHKEGKMTDAEYEKAKAILIGSVKAAAEKPKEGPRTGAPGFDVLPPKDDGQFPLLPRSKVKGRRLRWAI